MKNLRRAYRRYKQEVKFERRIDIYIQSWWHNKHPTSDIKNNIREGKESTFLRSTLNPCNCFSCSAMNKYNRNEQKKIDKLVIKEQLY